MEGRAGERDRDQVDAANGRAKILVALNSDSYKVRWRACRELLFVKKLQPAEWKALIDLVRRDRTGPPLLIDALARAGEPAVPDYLEILKAKETSEELFQAILMSLGRMGPKAKAAIPFLEMNLANPKLKAYWYEASLHVVLANIGYESQEHLDAIQKKLRNYRFREVAVGVLGVIRPGKWINKVAALDVDALSVITLGRLGERAPHGAAAKLRKLFDGYIKRDDPYAILVGLALARVDPKNRDAALRAVCANWERLGPKFGDGILIFPNICYRIVDAESSRFLARTLEDSDKKVALGASVLLSFAGVSGREAVPLVLKFLESDADDEVQLWAAAALHEIADSTHLPALRAALKKQESETIRRELRRTINLISHVAPTDGPAGKNGQRRPKSK